MYAKFFKLSPAKFFSSNCFNRNCFIEMTYYESGKDFFPARSQKICKNFKSKKVYVGEMQKCCSFIEILHMMCR